MSNQQPPPPYNPKDYNPSGYQQYPHPTTYNTGTHPYNQDQPPHYNGTDTYASPRQPLLGEQSNYQQPQPSYQHHITTIIQPGASVVVVGGCPACRVGVLEDDYTCFGVCCAIFCFPLGILCCLATKQRRCPNCGAIFA